MCAPHGCADVVARVIIFLMFCGAQFVNDFFFVVPLYKDGGIARILCLVLLPFWIVFFVLCFWSYLKVCWLDPGSVLYELKRLGYVNADGTLKELPPPIAELPRCEKCGLPKPERTHHCKICGRCYFRFDHHCPVVGNCIALSNLKAFALLGIHGGISFLILIIYSMLSIGFAWRISRGIIGCIAVFAFFCCVSLFGFGVSWIQNIRENQTTLESIANMKRETYDVGRKQNVEQIFGKNKFLWIFPTDAAVSGWMWSGITITDGQFDQTTPQTETSGLTNQEIQSNDEMR